jgi:hypothetical protein
LIIFLQSEQKQGGEVARRQSFKVAKFQGFKVGIRTLETSAIFSYLTIHRNRDVFSRFNVAKLDHLMFIPGELSPVARFFGILFNRLERPTIQPERYHPQSSSADALHLELLPIEQDLVGIHQLDCDRR